MSEMLFIPPTKNVIQIVDIWKNIRMNNHYWAFYYFCRRQGDLVSVTKNADGTVDLTVVHWE